jgi:hypothetical protein
LFLDLLANISRTQGSVGLHQDHAARFREAGLAPVALAIDQLQQFIAQHIIAKEVGQSGNGLLDRPNAAHQFRTLLQQMPQLLMSLPHNFLNMSMVVNGSNDAWLTFHKPSTTRMPRRQRSAALASLDDTQAAA